MTTDTPTLAESRATGWLGPLRTLRARWPGLMPNRPASRTQTARAATETIASRPLAERLDVLLGRGGEGLSPRALRRLLGQLRAICNPRVSEVEAGRSARAVADWYRAAAPAERRDLWLLMGEPFAADQAVLRAAREHHARAAGTPDAQAAEIRLRRALQSPRARLLQRFAVDAQGLRFLVDLRAELLEALPGDASLLALDAELEHLFSTWFDVAFLELRRISWDSPASLIEKLIRYEAVHTVRGWSDIKNRLDSDRRCYGFFHPRLPDEPLIFVEVALVDAVSDGIVPLLDEHGATGDPQRASTAIFYSISNTQAGLRGVSFGDSLIKHVVDTLCAEFPRLRTFATLSPIPGFRTWLQQEAGALLGQWPEARRAALGQAVGFTPPAPEHVLAAAGRLEGDGLLHERGPLRDFLLFACAHYLARALPRGKPADAVARFHLGNGARVERLNWAGDPSAKGMKQAYGLMVNYLYDLRRLDRHRDLLAGGRVPTSAAVDALLKP